MALSLWVRLAPREVCGYVCSPSTCCSPAWVLSVSDSVVRTDDVTPPSLTSTRNSLSVSHLSFLPQSYTYNMSASMSTASEAASSTDIDQRPNVALPNLPLTLQNRTYPTPSLPLADTKPKVLSNLEVVSIKSIPYVPSSTALMSRSDRKVNMLS